MGFVGTTEMRKSTLPSRNSWWDGGGGAHTGITDNKIQYHQCYGKCVKGKTTYGSTNGGRVNSALDIMEHFTGEVIFVSGP